MSHLNIHVDALSLSLFKRRSIVVSCIYMLIFYLLAYLREDQLLCLI